MILKSELTGRNLKQAGFYSAAYRWHNKNKSGGNFGINLLTSQNWQDRHFELTGTYNTKGEITSLRLGELYQAGSPLTLKDLDIDRLVNAIKNGMERIKARSVTP